ncbi:M56 family metallopeptidase [Paenibacillus sp. NPDC058174]|uniref:M56 family metallopeptidase n=1 Tax=Paenibacillus sp. NPDC058174 TaxID=3346366 RepID=UPI0036DA0963
MRVFYGGFALLLEGTLAASVVILIILAIQQLFRKMLSPRIRHLLWLLVIIRLLLPVFPESTVSIFQIIDYGRTLPEQVWHLGGQSDTLAGAASSQPSGLVAQQGIEEQAAAPASTEGSQQTKGQDNGTAGPMAASPVLKIAAFVWLAGMLVLLANLLIFVRRMASLRSQLTRVADSNVIAVRNKALRSFKITKEIPLYTGESASSPYLSGLLRPWIFIPQKLIQDLDSEQLYHILAHELAHYKRKDMLWNLLGSLAAAIHWFNPLIWLVMRRMKADRELACDAYVLEKVGEEEAVAYGMTMLSFLKRYAVAGESRGLLYFYNSRGQHEMVRRIMMIKSFKKGSYKFTIAAVLFITALSAMTLTNASASTLPPAGIDEALKAKEDFITSKGFRIYNSLDRTVSRSDFAFEAPSALPSGYLFREAGLSGTVTPDGYERIDQVSLSFYTDGSKLNSGWSHYGPIRVQATNLKFTKSHLELVDSLKQSLQNKKTSLAEKDIIVGERKVHQMMVTIDFDTSKSHDYYFLWEHNGVSYRLDLAGFSSEQHTNELASLLISSMKLPDDNMKSTYINKDALTVDVVDVEDLKLAQSAIGFMPKLPLTVSAFTLKSAFVTSKINFSSPRNEQEALTRVLASEYESPVSAVNQNPQSFWLYQIKDDGQYADFKANKKAQFFRLDGGQVQVPAQLISIDGKELLRTSPYQSDGSLGNSTAPAWISCFWIDRGVTYRLAFKEGQVDDPLALAAALIKASAVKL